VHALMVLVLIAFSTCSALEVATNCSALQTYGDCSPHLHCEWCGIENQSYPTSMCFERGAGLSCCTAKNNNTMCSTAVSICTASETCYQSSIYTYYGTCLVPTCCGADKPIPCGASCVATDGVCCSGGLPCNAGQTCCGGEDVGFACCDKGGSCCTAPDGYAHWCCPASQQCNYNGGCNPAAEDAA
jgi:hypothetical protein